MDVDGFSSTYYGSRQSSKRAAYGGYDEEKKRRGRSKSTSNATPGSFQEEEARFQKEAEDVPVAVTDPISKTKRRASEPLDIKPRVDTSPDVLDDADSDWIMDDGYVKRLNCRVLTL